MDGNFTVKGEQIMAVQAFVGRKYFFALLPTDFGKRSVKNHDTLQVSLYFECGRQKICPITFQVFELSFLKVFHGLIIRWIREIHQKDVGNIPSGVSCCHIPSLEKNLIF